MQMTVDDVLRSGQHMLEPLYFEQRESGSQPKDDGGKEHAFNY